MNKIKSIIVEDEINSLERLQTLLSEFKEIEIIGTAADGDEAVAKINELKPDLIFLDIQLPVLNGFSVLQKITAKPKVVFVTSYDQYAIKAFEENAVDYILKPTSKERLAKCINKVKEISQPFDENLIRLLKRSVYPEFTIRFAVKVKDEVLILPSEKVFYFRADNKYLFLATNEREYFYESTLKSLEETLDPNAFIRVSKSHIVAIDKVLKFSKWFLGDYNVVLSDKNSATIKVGRKYLPQCRERFKF